MGIIPDTLEDWLGYYQGALNRKCLDDEGFVLDAERLLNYITGKRFKVTKKAITGIEDIIKPTPVWYSIDGKSGHWVVVANGKIVFNPLEVSRNVNQGKPRDARIIELAA